MRQIRRYELPWNGTAEPITLALPRDAQVLRFNMLFSYPDNNSLRRPNVHPTIWAIVDTTKPDEQRRFLLVATDGEVREAAAYVGGYEEWHLLEPAVIPIPDHLRGMLPDFPAVNAYRLLIKEGFTLGEAPGGGYYWSSPDDEPLTAEQTLALGELQQHGFIAV